MSHGTKMLLAWLVAAALLVLTLLVFGDVAMFVLGD